MITIRCGQCGKDFSIDDHLLDKEAAPSTICPHCNTKLRITPRTKKSYNGLVFQEQVLSVKNINKSYSLGGNLLHVLKDINMEIWQGEFISIMGPSGCGKSTLMNLIGCLDTPSHGNLILNGRDISQLKEDQLAHVRGRTIGFIFQTFNLIPRTSALKNVELAMTFAGVPRERRKARGKLLLERVGLKDRMNHAPSELSGGERQRIAIARALANNPSIILADEPTGNLDSKRGKEIMELIKNLNKKEGKTVIMVTHDPGLARYADRIYHMRDGVIERVENIKKPAHPNGGDL